MRVEVNGISLFFELSAASMRSRFRKCARNRVLNIQRDVEGRTAFYRYALTGFSLDARNSLHALRRSCAARRV
jgi:hypothetical protein